MKAVILFLIIFLTTISQLLAQNQDSISVRKYYEENTILWLGGRGYYKNNQFYSLSNLKNEIIYSPDAIDELRQFRRDRTIAQVSALLGYGLFLFGINAKDENLQGGLLLGSIAAFTISIPVHSKANTHLSKAIWMHNRDVLLK